MKNKLRSFAPRIAVTLLLARVTTAIIQVFLPTSNEANLVIASLIVFGLTLWLYPCRLRAEWKTDLGLIGKAFFLSLGSFAFAVFSLSLMVVAGGLTLIAFVIDPNFRQAMVETLPTAWVFCDLLITFFIALGTFDQPQEVVLT